MMSSNSVDVVVVGGGPAGSAAAITLGLLGRQTLVVDKATFPRDKCCGDGLTTGALRRLEALGLDPARVPSWEIVAEAAVRAPGGRVVRIPFPADGSQYAASARRADLDSALLDVAVASGARVLPGRGATGARAVSGGVEVDLDDGSPVRARYLIAADGMWSPLRKVLGQGEPGYLGEWHAARQYFRDVGPEARRLWVWFEEDLLPGYAWSFPLAGGTANVGYGVHRAPGVPTGRMREQWAQLLRRPHVVAVLGPHARPEGPWKAWPIPARVRHSRQSALGGRVLFVGDAARAPDPMTGEGIAQALETGKLAGRAVACAGPDHPTAAAARYERQVAWGLAVDERLSVSLSRVLARRRGADAWAPIADFNGWARSNFARWMFEDFPRAVLVTPHRWRRGLLHQPGAFSGYGKGYGSGRASGETSLAPGTFQGHG